VNTSRTTRTIAALPDIVFQAFVDPNLLIQWQAPDNMTAKIHRFDAHPGGSYEVSLFYDDPAITGKTQDNEDRYTATFVELVQPRRIVESIVFASDSAPHDPMIMTVELDPVGVETRVTISFENLPLGVSPADNDLGTQQSLAKLARLVERK
jgi:uncharacterized protein YndB with AHSA1/START domain